MKVGFYYRKIFYYEFFFIKWTICIGTLFHCCKELCNSTFFTSNKVEYFIALFLCITYVSALIITNRTSIAILAGLGISGILGMNYLIGFNLINTILLASFIMGVGLLTAKHHE